MRSAARVELSESDKRFNYTHESSVEGRGSEAARAEAGDSGSGRTHAGTRPR